MKINQAKAYLSRAYCLEQQVQSKLAQLEALRSLACRMTASFDRTPVSNTLNTTSMQDTIIRITEAEEELNKKIDELVAMKVEISHTIDRVRDVQLRLLLEKRYLLFLSWPQIAEDLMISDRWLQKRHDDALAAVRKVLVASGEMVKIGKTAKTS